MLERIRKGSLVETAIESLRNAIEKGDWSVGDRLPVEQELSDSLGVSRNTVREAVGVLVHVGMLETVQDTAPSRSRPPRRQASLPGGRYPASSMSRLVPAILLLTVLLSLQTGCTAPSPTRGGFASPAPAARTHAVEVTVRNANARGYCRRD